MTDIIDVKSELTERLSRYVRIHTTSDPNSDKTPSTDCQWDLLHLLHNELNEMGLSEISLDGNGYLFASLPANKDNLPVLGLLAHVDTSPAFNGENVQPQIIKNYDGSDIPLAGSNDCLSAKDYPELKTLIGQDLMTTDGTSLLGADDKAGIAIILTAIKWLQAHPEIPHGKIRIGFTPDEEIGRGPKKFDVEQFAADVAYTLDGSYLGELQYENFNAAEAVLTCFGYSIHLGSAKDKLINAYERVCEFNQALPEHLRPETSEGKEGFIHLHTIQGSLDEAQAIYALRDFTREGLAEKKSQLQSTFQKMQAQYGEPYGKLEIKDQYANMAEKIAEHPYLISLAKEAMQALNITPICEPIRGGTDGAQLSYMGLPTPNLFTGGANFHGKYEYISLDVMNLSTNVLLKLIQNFAHYHFNKGE